MWKLFFKNKKTEILNWMHYNQDNLLIGGALFAFIVFAIGFALFLTYVPQKIQFITIGLMVLWLIVIKLVIPFIKWIINNYKMAKQGIEVKPYWMP